MLVGKDATTEELRLAGGAVVAEPHEVSLFHARDDVEQPVAVEIAGGGGEVRPAAE